jgi:predicted transcriptional regulator
MDVSVSLPDEVARRAEELADELGVSRDELYAAAITRFVNGRHAEEITERLDEVYAEADSDLDDALKRLQAASLPVERW